MDTLILNKLSCLQAALWFLEHERLRHCADIFDIDIDIKKLKDNGVALPEDVLTVLGARFEILNS